MATDLTALTVALGVSLRAMSQRALDLTTPEDVASLSKVLNTTFGTGASKANQIWHDRRVLAGAAADSLDLAGVLTNAYGQTVTFANVKAILLFNRSDETLAAPGPTHAVTDAAVTIGNGATPFIGPFGAAAHTLTVPAGGMFLITAPTAAGWAVTAATADILKILNADATDEAAYDIVVVGESA